MLKAVISVKNQQYVVEEGVKIQCDRLAGQEGDKLDFPILGFFRDFRKTGIVEATIIRLPADMIVIGLDPDLG